MSVTNYSAFESNINYDFQKKSLLELALTHRSYGQSNNERLEFLGDSIVNFVVGEFLFLKFPEAKEGQLSRMRAAQVSGEGLAEVAKSLRLPEYLLLGEGEKKSGGRKRPSILAGAMEALIGAIYLDSNFEVCKQKVLAWYQPRLEKVTMTQVCVDAKTELQEFLQARQMALPEYKVVDQLGQSHEQVFVVHCRTEFQQEVAEGRGSSKRKAEQQAAQLMLEKIRDE